jgi:ubiquinol-cytochrome c reductase cytochrome b subunit
MGGALLVLFALPFLDRSNLRGLQFKPLTKASFWIFIANFLFLMKLGSLHPEEPFTTLGLMCTGFYFSWFLIIIPVLSLIENGFSHISVDAQQGEKSVKVGRKVSTFRG